MYLLQLRQGTQTLALQSAPPFRAAQYTPAGGTGEMVPDSLRLALEGSPLEIERGLEQIGCLLDEAQRWAEIPGAEYVYLEAQVHPQGALWRSKLLGGYLTLLGAGPDQRGGGSQGAQLTFTRVNYWEGAEQDLPLSNQNGSRVTSGLLIYNHRDSTPGHENRVLVAGADLAGDLPAPVRLLLDGLDTDMTGTLYAGQSVYSDPANLITSQEGQAGFAGGYVTGTVIAQADASGGSFQRLAWTGADDMALWSFTILPTWANRLGGNAFLPLLRLQNPLAAGEKLHARWRAYLNTGSAHPIYEGPAFTISSTAMLHPAAPLNLPPWLLTAADLPSGLSLELRVQAESSGAHQLDLDYLYLLPLDGWRIYRPLFVCEIPLLVLDDPYSGTLKTGDLGLQTHIAEGPGLWLVPGRANACYFLSDRYSGGWGPGTRSSVRISYRPRRRAL